MPPRRLRLDAELVRRGLARSREHAAELIDRRPGHGVGRRPPTKPATAVTTDVAIVVRRGPGPTRVRLPRRAQARRRAGRVRAARARAWPGDAASTPAPRPAGSPTCCCGAARAEVVAVDVGYGQLAWPLRSDDRVRVHDRTNVRDADRRR